MPKRKRGNFPKLKMEEIDEVPDKNALFSDESSEESETDSLKMEFPNYLSDEEQEEVLPIDDDESDDENNEAQFNNDEDDDDDENDDYEETNDLEAWGKRKANYFNADFVDEDRGRSYRENDLENAQFEEMDALDTQRRFLENVHSSAFDVKSFSVSEPKTESLQTQFATVDWNLISKTDKVQVLNKQSPEFLSMMKKFRQKLVELKQLKPKPLKEFEADNKNGKKNARVCHLKSQLLTHYIMNLSFYMALKSKNNSSLEEPVLAKIKFFENLINEMEKLEARQYLRAKLKKTHSKKAKTVRFADDSAVDKNGDSNAKIDDNDDIKEDNTEEATEDKRIIPYQISKNKGLLPYRKKEYRNPRVRHRMKYKKAMVRRKGQVRTPRTETTRYGGEMSGINPYVSKSIKFK